jgi:hypothetical protein
MQMLKINNNKLINKSRPNKRKIVKSKGIILTFKKIIQIPNNLK